MNIINIGILAHVDAGKTSVTENMLHLAGIIKEVGRVDKGNTVTDSMTLEKQRGITIKTTSVSFEWKNTKINLLDTPGHVDFIAEVERSVHVLDGAILVISAKEGIQSQTRVIFKVLNKLQIPTIIFINKLDRQGVNLTELYQNIREKLSENIFIMQNIEIKSNNEILINSWKDNIFLKKDNIERICLNNENLLEDYINDKKISEETINLNLKHCIRKSLIYPIFHGSALKEIGIKELLNGAVEFFHKKPAENVKNMSAVVYKIDRDKNNSKNIYLRIFNGNVSIREMVDINSKEEKSLKIKNLQTLSKGKIITTDIVTEGDIAILPNIDQLKIGDYIGARPQNLVDFNLATPTLKTTVTPSNKNQRVDLIQALFDLSEEDPLLKCSIDSYTQEIVVHLFGEVQKEVIKYTLEERFNLKSDFSETMIIYKETPIKTANAYIQMGKRPNPFRASIGFTIEPTKIGEGFIYESKVSYGFITKSFQNAVFEGVCEGIRQGVYGWELTDIKVIFDKAEFCSVTSTPADFRDLAPLVLMDAVKLARTKLLEPILHYTLIIPKEVVGKAISDLRRMKATMSNPELKNTEMIIKGRISLQNAKNYNIEVAAYTEGKGVFETQFCGYEPYEGEIKTKKKTGYDPSNRTKYLLQKSKSIKIT